MTSIVKSLIFTLNNSIPAYHEPGYYEHPAKNKQILFL